MQVQEFKTLEFSTHLSIINSGKIPANAMDESNKKSDFNKDFSEFIEDLCIDEQVNQIEESMDQHLYQIQKMIQHLPMLKNTSEFSEYSKKLTQLIQKLITQIEEKKCPKTKARLINLFEHVETNIFKPQLKIIKDALKQ